MYTDIGILRESLRNLTVDLIGPHLRWSATHVDALSSIFWTLLTTRILEELDSALGQKEERAGLEIIVAETLYCGSVANASLACLGHEDYRIRPSSAHEGSRLTND
jgi:hypothetical protein